MGEERVVVLYLGLLSEAELATGDANAAAEAASEALHWGEKSTLYRHIGSLLYTRGDAMVALDDRAQAEADYHRALTWSHEHNNKWDELNAALRLGRLWQADGHADRARELLTPVYDGFTEGFDNPVLRDAKALLDELTGAPET
jgi:tetratricopeptide (TPR) repeat protein